jgi:FtsP/CotA-like multicopper oxidase with cupredoxin domain
MKTITTNTTNTTKRKDAKGRLVLATLAALCAASVRAQHAMSEGMHLIDGLTNTVITLTAKSGHLSTADGNSVFFWGLAPGGGSVQYPAPTLIVPQGALVQITLQNTLSEPTSLVFPGQAGVTASGGSQGALSREAPPGGSVTYSFTASKPGTFTYHSGTRPDLQIEMGLTGALIVRPVLDGEMIHNRAYAHADTEFDHEFLFLLSEMDDKLHALVEQGALAQVDTTKWWPVYWFMNGRTGPDTMLESYAAWLPTQPYDCMPMFRPGERVLMRVVGGGRDPHPLHHHGNNSSIIARNGRLLASMPAAGADLAESVFTIPVAPGETTDAIFTWTGAKLGWDIYGHTPEDPLEPNEYAPDHGKPFPVTLPLNEQLTFGVHYSGSPFLGAAGALPPGQGGFNPSNGYMFMWHSHNEKEICNNDLFPGGMMTMALVSPYPHTNMPMNVQAP